MTSQRQEFHIRSTTQPVGAPAREPALRQEYHKEDDEKDEDEEHLDDEPTIRRDVVEVLQQVVLTLLDIRHGVINVVANALDHLLLSCDHDRHLLEHLSELANGALYVLHSLSAAVVVLQRHRSLRCTYCVASPASPTPWCDPQGHP